MAPIHSAEHGPESGRPQDFNDLNAALKTLTLTDFVLARVVDDEAAASAFGPSVRQWDHETDEGEYVATIGATVAKVNLIGWGAHIARHDPARVLAECEAKRQRVAILAEMEVSEENVVSSYAHSLLCREALPYADHPEWREEWRA